MGLSFNFLNRDNSPSSKNKAKFKDSSGNTINQAGRDVNVSLTAATPKPRIDFGDQFVTTGSADGYVLYFNVVNDGDASAVDISYFLTADDLEVAMTPKVIARNLSVGQTSMGLVTIKLQATEFYTKKLTNPRIVFVYKDRSGKEFRGGRYILQELRADQNFNINRGDYFEVTD